jgi:hypothetical protein
MTPRRSIPAARLDAQAVAAAERSLARAKEVLK